MSRRPWLEMVQGDKRHLVVSDMESSIARRRVGLTVERLGNRLEPHGQLLILPLRRHLRAVVRWSLGPARPIRAAGVCMPRGFSA